MRTKLIIALAAIATTLATSVFAQAPSGVPTNVRGKIVKVDGQNLVVKTREGPTVTIALAPNTGVRVMKKAKLRDINEGDYLSILSVPGKDGQAHAVEIHWLPAQAPERQGPYDYAPGSMMTNAHVDGVAKAKSGNVLTVTQKGVSSDVIVDRKTAIDAALVGKPSDLKSGRAVFLRASATPDGSYSADNVTVEKNGVKPMM